MYWMCLVFWAATATAQYDSVETRAVSFPGKASSLGSLYTSGLGGGSQGYRDNSYEDNAVTPSPSPSPIYRTPGSQVVYRKPTSSQAVRVGTQQRGNARGPPFSQNPPDLEELEDEKEEPDRLSLLLPQSKFDCINKQTGYYADEDLNCEVFHYCQDNAKHSWICPAGFTFHQVHLICMPPSGEKDISCKKSSQYHFVNEYLYKPLNLAEAESKPNVTLRYSERYFPEDIYTDERDSQYYHHQQNSASPRRPVQQQPLYLNQQPTTINSLPSGGRPQQQSVAPYRLPSLNQVFRSPEEVNIPLQQRRPQTQQALRRLPQVRPDEEDYE